MSARRIAFLGECMVELYHRPGDEPGLLRRTVGGDTLNAAVYCRRALGEAGNVEVAYVTRLGDDPFGREIPAFCAGHGIATDLIEMGPGETTGLYAISRDEAGERSFTYWRSAAAARSLFAKGGHKEIERAVESCDALFFSGITLAILAPEGRERLLVIARRMRDAGKLVGFDGNYRPRLWSDVATARRAIRAGHAVATLTMPGLDDEHALFGEETAEAAARRLIEFGAKSAIVKRGGGAAVLLDRQGLREVGAPALPGPIVDTTAAGDSFDGAALAALLLGGDLDAAAAAGHRMAGLVIGGYGAIVDDPRTRWNAGPLAA
ncbi:sugar kinase [Aureimonas sp. AU4]|uniref:sugar kinase n=1 Tax=Aureimonas sp. AU4 TaxID=1638163 RepID=UPI0007804D13|nr:sugar kinase [Aureimonas sp. AU4]